MFMSIVNFIKSKTFFKHFSLAAFIVVILFWCAFKYINYYTLHNETIAVPNFTDLKTTELDKFIEGKNLRYVIVDSVYSPKKAKGIVLKQDPEPNTSVKRNRTIYLYVTAVSPPQVKMPQLKDKSLRQAISMIEAYGLKLGKVSYTPDQCINCVLNQLVKGKKVEAGTIISKGTTINLIVGKGLSDEEVLIPNLIGLTRNEALTKLSELALNEGALYFESSKDSLKAKVYKQNPPFSEKNKTTIPMGSSIDLFFNTISNTIPLDVDSTQ